jgi:hypothetical protein
MRDLLLQGIEETVCDTASFRKNCDRLRVARRSVAAGQVQRLPSSDPFSVDGTLLQVWAGGNPFRWAGGNPFRSKQGARKPCGTDSNDKSALRGHPQKPWRRGQGHR